jgi:hypothetical protein
MSKKSETGKGDNSEVEEFYEGIVESQSAIEIGYLTSIILDYYGETGFQPLEEGEEWKESDPEKYRVKGIQVPSDLDAEIKKAFMAQIKKFQ